MALDLEAYFERIGYDGTTSTDLNTLHAMHRAQITGVPYENLEIQLGRQKVVEEPAFFELVVARRRGGWCYDLNGLLTTALRQLGFSVRRVGGAVDRKNRGDDAIGNHLVGLVDIDGSRFVVDVGLGDGPLEPFELKEGAWQEGELEFRLERLGGGWWRFHNHPHGLAPSFDFNETERDLGWYAPVARRLQTDPASPFVNFAIAMRRTASGSRALRDATLIEVRDGQRSETRIEHPLEYREALGSILASDLGEEVERLWTGVQHRVAQRAAGEVRHSGFGAGPGD